MFESLTEKFTSIFSRLSSRGRLSPKDVDDALRQVRVALLEADVNLKVVREFTARLRERCLRAEVLESLTPAEQVIKIVYEELVSLLGQGEKLHPGPRPPSIAMLVGLQGSGKTTTAAKLALHLRRQGQNSLLVAADPYRPAAVEQLSALGRQLNIPVYGDRKAPLELCREALKRGRELGVSWVIIDTAGRLHIDQEMMAELKELKTGLVPQEVLLVVDAMTGQDGVRVAEEFHQEVGLTGVIISKLDGDARGGIALSVREVTGVPIKFIGVGEKPDALEPFYPERLASRILGMGDIATLMEKAERALDEKRAREMEKKLRTGEFDLEDFLAQIGELKKMGPLSQLLELIPGLSMFASKLTPEDEKRIKHMEAIILSMTPEERRHPEIIDGSRRRRIARGSGTTVQEVNQLLKTFFEIRKLMKELSRGKLKGLFRAGPTRFPWIPPLR